MNHLGEQPKHTVHVPNTRQDTFRGDIITALRESGSHERDWTNEKDLDRD